MVADSGPQRSAAQLLRIHIEHRRLVVTVQAAEISIVSEHQPHICVASCGIGIIGVAHHWLTHITRLRNRAAIAQRPNPSRLSRQRRGDKEKFRSTGKTRRGRANRVKIFRVRRQIGEREAMFTRKRRIAHFPRQIVHA